MEPPTYEAILFDFDGVLVDSEPVHLDCWMEVLAPFGIHVDWQTYAEQYIGVDDRLMLASLCKLANPPVEFDDAWAQYPNKKRLFEDRMHRADAMSVEVSAMLKRLHAMMKLAIVTSSARSEIEPILKATNILAYIDTAVYGDDVRRHKPAPDPYLLAAERLGVRRALVVEDSQAGLEAGRAAGFEVLHVPRQCEMIGLLNARLSHHDSEPDQADR